MASYYEPDHYVAKIAEEIKYLASSLKERGGGATALEKKISELEQRLKALESKVK